MSAAVCGSKRSYYFFEDVPSPPLSKKIRRVSSTSPPRFTPPPLPQSQILDQLKALFPLSDVKVLEKVVEECEDDLEEAVKRLRDEVSVGPTEVNSGCAEDVVEDLAGPTSDGIGDVAASTENTTVPGNVPANGAEWVELFVSEMMNAASVDDARSRASRVLEILEKTISAHAAEGAAQSFQKEHMMLKEQVEALMRENTILKRAVAIQHERQKEFEDKNRELQHLKQLLSQYQEQLRTLEVNNYALMMHLRQAQQSSPISGHFNPDVF